jgi:CheY-like chemotaxis protein
MTMVLIAEDSPTQAVQIRGLLESGGYQAQVVGNGIEALAAIAAQPPIAVLTDLDMPQMNGLDLVTAVRRDYAHIPVILMTAFGSEEIAIQALQAGAASYVPKKNLSTDLISTLREVLEVARAVQEDARLAEYLSGLEAQFELTSAAASVMPIVGYLQDAMARLHLGDENERLRLGVALDAAIQNAIYYGNLEFTPEELHELQHLDDAGKAFHRQIHERSVLSPYCDRKVVVRLAVSPSEVTCEVRHSGPGYDAKAALDGDDVVEMDGEHAPGWLLIKSLLGKVTFSANGQQVTLSKRYRL